MPVYEYRCESCGEVFETIQKFVDAPLTVHEKCGGSVQRLISAPALQFKGTGWYVTDYAKSGAKAEKSEGNGKKEEPAKKTETSGSTEQKSSSPTTTAAPTSTPASSGSSTK